jgi:hypothetical protein
MNGGNADITELDIARYFETLDISVRHKPILDGPEKKTTDVAAARLFCLVDDRLGLNLNSRGHHAPITGSPSRSTEKPRDWDSKSRLVLPR